MYDVCDSLLSRLKPFYTRLLLFSCSDVISLSSNGQGPLRLKFRYLVIYVYQPNITNDFNINLSVFHLMFTQILKRG